MSACVDVCLGEDTSDAMDACFGDDAMDDTDVRLGEDAAVLVDCNSADVGSTPSPSCTSCCRSMIRGEMRVGLVAVGKGRESDGMLVGDVVSSYLTSL